MGLLLCFLVTAGPFHRYDLALLATPLGLLLAALVYVRARGPTPACVAVLAGVGFVNGGLLWMAERVWQPWYLSRGEPHTWWPLLLFLAGPLLGGLLLGLLGRPLRRALRRAQA